MDDEFREEKRLERRLAHAVFTGHERLWDELCKVFEATGFDMAYFKVHMTLKLSVERGNREPTTITVEKETDEPLEGG